MADCAVLGLPEGLQDAGARCAFRGRRLPGLKPLGEAPGTSLSLSLRAAAETRPRGGRVAPINAHGRPGRTGLPQGRQAAESARWVTNPLGAPSWRNS